VNALEFVRKAREIKESVRRHGVLPKHWTTGMLGFPPTEENQHEEEQIYR
jgi:hypothetical protein